MDEALATPAIDPGDLAELAVKNAQLAVDTLSLVPPTGTLRLECEAQEGAALTQSREQSEARHLQVIELVAAASGRGR